MKDQFEGTWQAGAPQHCLRCGREFHLVELYEFHNTRFIKTEFYVCASRKSCSERVKQNGRV